MKNKQLFQKIYDFIIKYLTNLYNSPGFKNHEKYFFHIFFKIKLCFLIKMIKINLKLLIDLLII